MKTWNEMTYDEQRALLGLPDVRSYVARYKLRSGFAQMAGVFARFGKSAREAMQADYALAGSKESE